MLPLYLSYDSVMFTINIFLFLLVFIYILLGISLLYFLFCTFALCMHVVWFLYVVHTVVYVI